jgi:hypothetical protein
MDEFFVAATWIFRHVSQYLVRDGIRRNLGKDRERHHSLERHAREVVHTAQLAKRLQDLGVGRF